MAAAVPVTASGLVIHNHWAHGHRLPVTRGDFGITTGHDGRIYLVGGSDGIATYQTTLIYTPTTNSWTSGPDFPGSGGYQGASVTGPSGMV